MAYEVWAEYEGEAPEMVTKTLAEADAERVKAEYAAKSNVIRAWVKETDEYKKPTNEPTEHEKRTNSHWYFKGR